MTEDLSGPTRPGERWMRESASPGWSDRVVAALRACVARAESSSELQVTDIRVARGKGPNIIDLVYRASHADDRARGLQLDASVPPPVGGDEEEDLASALASWVVTIELQEPRGNRRDDTWLGSDGIEWRVFPAP